MFGLTSLVNLLYFFCFTLGQREECSDCLVKVCAGISPVLFVIFENITVDISVYIKAGVDYVLHA